MPEVSEPAAANIPVGELRSLLFAQSGQQREPWHRTYDAGYEGRERGGCSHREGVQRATWIGTGAEGGSRRPRPSQTEMLQIPRITT
jgi:ribosome modulation factor